MVAATGLWWPRGIGGCSLEVAARVEVATAGLW